MTEPIAERPYMTYGVPKSPEGLLPWSWAEERLARSRNYWIGTVSPDGRPHSTAVWGVWQDDRFYFSMDAGSLKGRNLAANPRVVVTTENAAEAVILEGVFEGRVDDGSVVPVRDSYEKKYVWQMEGYEFFGVRPFLAFGFIEAPDKFSQSATRWRFASA
jgi:hypothetical protein